MKQITKLFLEGESPTLMYDLKQHGPSKDYIGPRETQMKKVKINTLNGFLITGQGTFILFYSLPCKINYTSHMNTWEKILAKLPQVVVIKCVNIKAYLHKYNNMKDKD